MPQNPEQLPNLATPNVELRFPTKVAADAFVDGLNYVGDDRVTVLDTKMRGYGQTTVYLLDERP